VAEPDIAKIAAGLTKAQRGYLTKGVVYSAYEPDRLATYPPPNTHAVLMRLDLVKRCGAVTPLGLAVRNHIQQAGK
jgi:hypothetical protein